jgi:hypothetical protein
MSADDAVADVLDVVDLVADRDGCDQDDLLAEALSRVRKREVDR